MPVKHSLDGMLHKQGRLGCVQMKGYVIGTEGMSYNTLGGSFDSRAR